MTNGNITVTIDGKEVVLDATQVATVQAKMQAEYQQATDEARPALVKACKGCMSTLRLSKAGNPVVAVTLPNNITPNVLYFMVDKKLGSASKLYHMLKHEFPTAVDELLDMDAKQIDAESKELAILAREEKLQQRRNR